MSNPSITGADIRRFLPLFADLKQTAGIAETILEHAARTVDHPPAESEDVVDDRLGGRVNRIATDAARALPDLASAHAVLGSGGTAPACAAAALIRAAQGLLEEERSLQRVGRVLTAAEQDRIEAANSALPALERALGALDAVCK
jgi:hypothetical protein